MFAAAANNNPVNLSLSSSITSNDERMSEVTSSSSSTDDEPPADLGIIVNRVLPEHAAKGEHRLRLSSVWRPLGSGINTASPGLIKAMQARCSAAEAPAVMTMRLAGTCTPKRVAYQSAMRSRKGIRPKAGVYCVRPSCSAWVAACCTSGGAVKSGSPMLRNTMGASVCARVCASCAAALATSST